MGPRLSSGSYGSEASRQARGDLYSHHELEVQAKVTQQVGDGSQHLGVEPGPGQETMGSFHSAPTPIACFLPLIPELLLPLYLFSGTISRS